MCAIVKPLVRFGVIAGLGLGAAVLIAGPDRVAALAGSARSAVVSVIDSQIDDPTALRSQLRELAAKYPQRIDAVRGDLAELQEQMRQIRRDRDVSQRVVAMADKDLTSLKDMLARAEEARATHGPGRVITVSFNDRPIKMDEAYAKATQISQTKAAYAARAADSERTLGYLGQQEARMQELLAKLETEHADFQTQLWQIDHQVDAIARNDRLLEMLEQRQKQIDSYNRFDVVSLDQLNQRLAQIQAGQESKFKALAQSAERLNYEDEARAQVDAEQAARSEFERTTRTLEAGPAAEAPIQIAPGQAPETSAEHEGEEPHGPVAAGPLHIR